MRLSSRRVGRVDGMAAAVAIVVPGGDSTRRVSARQGTPPLCAPYPRRRVARMRGAAHHGGAGRAVLGRARGALPRACHRGLPVGCGWSAPGRGPNDGLPASLDVLMSCFSPCMYVHHMPHIPSLSLPHPGSRPGRMRHLMFIHSFAPFILVSLDDSTSCRYLAPHSCHHSALRFPRQGYTRTSTVFSAPQILVLFCSSPSLSSSLPRFVDRSRVPVVQPLPSHTHAYVRVRLHTSLLSAALLCAFNVSLVD